MYKKLSIILRLNGMYLSSLLAILPLASRDSAFERQRGEWKKLKSEIDSLKPSKGLCKVYVNERTQFVQ